MKLAISLPKWSDCHEMKSEHIDWTLGLKCDHQIWPRPWPWLWIFKVKYEICYISTKSGPIARRRKANISIWTLGLKCDNGFDLGHDLDISIFKVMCGLDHLVTKVRCKDLPDSDRGDFSSRRAVDSSSLLESLFGILHNPCFPCDGRTFISGNTLSICLYKVASVPWLIIQTQTSVVHSESTNIPCT